MATATITTATAAQSEWAWVLGQARVPRLRTMREFAEAEIVIPDGPYKGFRYRADRLPYAGLWLDAVDSGQFNEVVSTGPTQTGKSLTCFVLPVLYHLFERREPVICGLPKMDMADEKWAVDIEPVIRESWYRDFLPTSGTGSRGGSPKSGEPLRFGNGATLKFMSGGGDDKSRAGSTARVLVITETDGMDEAGEASREADKIKQLEGRTRAYGSNRMIYKECTVSIEKGHTWVGYNRGTRSRIVLPCPHCKAWVTPERQHLQGWQDAESEVEAADNAHFCCPECAQAWTEEERHAANHSAALVHGDQAVNLDGEIVGEMPVTRTLGFRWSAVNNLLVTAGDFGADEWKAQNADDVENAEKEMRQFVWCLPYIPPQWDATPLDAKEVAQRIGERQYTKEIVPEDTEHLTMGIDVHKTICFWSLIAWRPECRGHVIDYGKFPVPSERMDERRAIVLALAQFRDETVLAGWPTPGGDRRVPDQVWVDCGYQPEAVYTFTRQKESGRRFMPVKGCGVGQQYPVRYNQPKSTGNVVKLIGLNYHVMWYKNDRIAVIEVNADAWKSWLHERLTTEAGDPGSLVLYSATSRTEHARIAKHFTAEKQVEEFVEGKGTVRRWERLSRENHWLDTTYNACAAGHHVGVRLLGEKLAPRAANPKRSGLTMPDGRAFFIGNRN